jgi:hypothetical protein
MHSCEKGIAPGRATLLGIVVGELRAFPPDAVDVWRFPDHQALMIDARLHPADVIAHDEENVWFLLRGGRHTRRYHGNDACEKTKPFSLIDVHRAGLRLLFGCYPAETD